MDLLLHNDAFWVKNVGIIYQRLVNRMFEHYIGRNVKVYVDDMIVKIKSAKDRVSYLE